MAGWIDEERDWLPAQAKPKRAVGQEAEEKAEDEPPVVLYVPIVCPFCSGRECPTIASPKARAPGLRYHRCATCERTFKSLEGRRG